MKIFEFRILRILNFEISKILFLSPIFKVQNESLYEIFQSVFFSQLVEAVELAEDRYAFGWLYRDLFRKFDFFHQFLKFEMENLYEIFENFKISNTPFRTSHWGRRSHRRPLNVRFTLSPSISKNWLFLVVFFRCVFDAFWRSKMATLWRKISNFGDSPIGRRFSGCKWAFKN